MNAAPLLLDICTANVQGLARHQEKLLPYYNHVQQRPNCIYVLTETNFDPPSTKPHLLPPPPEVTALFTRDTGKSVGSGVALLLGVNIHTSSPPTILIPGYLVHVEFQWQQCRVDLYAVYSPPAGARTPQVKPLLTHITETITAHVQTRPHHTMRATAVVGDINAALRPLDKSSTAHKNTHDRHWLTLTKDLSLLDASHHARPTSSLFTLARAPYFTTPDHILLSKPLATSLHAVTTAHGLFKQGDHTPLHISLKPPPPLPKTSPQHHSHTNRIPLVHLHNPTLKPAIHAAIHSWPVLPPHSSPQAVWQNFTALLAMLKHLICRFSTRAAREERRHVRTIQQSLQRLHSTRPLTDAQARTQSDLIRLHENELSVLTTAHMARQLAFMNARTGLDIPVLCPLIHARSARILKNADSTITSLIHPLNGVVHTELPGQLESAHTFYSQLLQSQPLDATQPDIDDHDYRTILLTNLPQLTADQKHALVAPPTEAQALALLRRLKPHKAPGPDGLASDFYREFAEVLAPRFLPVLTAFHVSGYVPPDVKLGIVTPFYKGKGNRADLANWRPITLLNTPYKLLALYLGTRLTPLLPQLVSPGQTSNVPGRTCVSNVHAVSLAIAIATLKRADSVFLFLDSEKAFDNVKWPYLWDALAAFGIPPGFITLCTSLYTDAQVFVSINGHLTLPITLGKGVRQGCPASPILYILYLEPIRLALERPCPQSVRAWLPVTSPSTYAHADDLVIITDLDTAPRILRVLTLLQPRTGLKVNPLKSAALYLPTTDPPPADDEYPVPLHDLTQHSHTYLGVAVGGPAPDTITHTTAGQRLHGLLQKIGTSRHLPLFTRAALVQASSAGVMQYFMQAAYFPVSELKKHKDNMRRAFYGVTDNNTSKASAQFIAQPRLFLPRQKGGTGLHDLVDWQLALSRKLVHSLCNDVAPPSTVGPRRPPAPCTVLLKTLLQAHATRLHIRRDVRTFFWWPAADYTRVTNKMPLFWRKVLAAHLAYRPSSIVLPSATAVLDTLYFAAPAQPPPVPAPPLLGVTVTHADADNPAECPSPLPAVWTSYISHPAYLLHMPSPTDPPSRAQGSPVRHYYMLAIDQRLALDGQLAKCTPTFEWGSSLLPRGQASLPLALLPTVTQLFAGDRQTDDCKSHAFKLYQRRYQSSFLPCPYCSQPSSVRPGDPQSTAANFAHTAWHCRTLKATWRRIAPLVGLDTPPTMIPIALGITPRMQPVDPPTRLRYLVLHVVLWDNRFRIRTLHFRSKQRPMPRAERLSIAADIKSLDAHLLRAYDAKLTAQSRYDNRR